MLLGEGQAQHYMKTTNWESPERSLELQLGDQPPSLLYIQAQAIARQLHQAIPRASPKSINWNKTQACTQKSDDQLLIIITTDFRMFFNENSEDDSTQGVFILFIYFWLHWVFIAVHRLSLVAASGGYSSLRCTGFSLQSRLLLQSTGSRCTGFSSCGTWDQ